MALNKLKFNSLNVTPAASEAIRFNSSANGLETASAGGSLVKISSTTASSSSSISFTSGIDSTYKEYIFILNTIHPATDGTTINIDFSTDSGSSYSVTKTTTAFYAGQRDDAGDNFFSYATGADIAQGTGSVVIQSVSGDNDHGAAAILHLFDPSNTTFVKNFILTTSITTDSNYISNNYSAGYCNTTSAIDAVKFSMASGNIDSGTIALYGVS